MNFSRQAGLAAVASLLLAGCTQLGLSDPRWISTPETKGDLRLNMYACVSEYDPSHLYEMDNGHEYAVTGPFVSKTRTADVLDCLQARGWTYDTE